MSKIDLSNLSRRSACCHAEVDHNPPNSSNFRSNKSRHIAFDRVYCQKCGSRAEDFEVVTGDGTVIWPVPDHIPADEPINWNSLEMLFRRAL